MALDGTQLGYTTKCQNIKCQIITLSKYICQTTKCQYIKCQTLKIVKSIKNITKNVH